MGVFVLLCSVEWTMLELYFNGKLSIFTRPTWRHEFK